MLQNRDFTVRQAECAAMLVAMSRILLDLDAHSFAEWLRTIADDIESDGVEKALGMVMAANDACSDAS